MGGSLTGEHGIGMEKRDYLADMFSAAEIDLMHRLPPALDPPRTRHHRPAGTQTSVTRKERLDFKRPSRLHLARGNARAVFETLLRVDEENPRFLFDSLIVRPSRNDF